MDVGQDPPQDFFLLLGFVRDFFSIHDLDFFILFPGTGKDFFLYCCFRIFFPKKDSQDLWFRIVWDCNGWHIVKD